MTDLRIANVRFAAASPEDVERGLLGWASFTMGGSLRVDGIAVRRCLTGGRLALSFPARRDAQGRQHAIVRPLNDRARIEIETQVFRALGFDARHDLPSKMKGF